MIENKRLVLPIREHFISDDTDYLYRLIATVTVILHRFTSARIFSRQFLVVWIDVVRAQRRWLSAIREILAAMFGGNPLWRGGLTQRS